MGEKWIVVTGASSGIGLQTAKQLALSGYSVFMTAKNKEKLEESIRACEGLSTNDKVSALAWDLSAVETIAEYSNRVVEKVGKIAGLVHCAGIQKTQPIHTVKYSQILEVFNINTFATMQLITHFSKKNKYVSGETSFVMMSSLAAHEGAYGKSIYAASKGALEGFLQASAAELSEKGIRINSIAPGVVNTEMVEAFFKRLRPEQREILLKDYPFGFGQPSDVANMIEFLISNKAKWITGQNFILDGGHLTRKA